MEKILLFLAVFLASTGFVKDKNAENNSLKLAAVFSDHMVLQRNKPIVIYGKAKAEVLVKVRFLNKTLVANSDKSGQWKVVFPALKHGGPFEIIVSEKDQRIVLNDIIIGDVWLCSGQSNMDFQLKDSKTGPEELKQTDFNTNIRLLKMGGLVSTGDFSWDSVALAKVNLFEFFSGKWKTLNATSAASFSAVAYYFGKKIRIEENVPIGLIQIALGGSPTESWVERSLLESDEQFDEMLNNWQNSEEVMQWCRERAAVNIANANSVKQRHPYQPSYNFQAGIAPLTNFSIAGVIWYQGESNVFNVPLHVKLFEMLVKNWRQKWGYEFPFYYVQLSGINRLSWPEFRDSQQQMLTKIPNSGMAVSYDLGDSLNVHPTRKKEIGERLAVIAMRNFYHKNVVANGPVPEKAYEKNGEIVLNFSSVKKLSTPENVTLIGFEIINHDGKRLPANAVIENNKVRIAIPAGEKIKTVLYAYQPFTQANLYNEAGLPASTFSISVQ